MSTQSTTSKTPWKLISIAVIVISVIGLIWFHASKIRQASDDRVEAVLLVDSLKYEQKAMVTVVEGYKSKIDSLKRVIEMQDFNLEQSEYKITQQRKKYEKAISAVQYLDADSTYRLFTDRTNGNR